jgi:hypothetical protein
MGHRETDMNKYFTQSQTPKAGALTCIAGFALLVMLGNASTAAAQLSCPVCAVANRAMDILGCVLLATASQACIFDQQQLLQTFAQSLISLWLLLFVIAAAVLLLRAVFGRNTKDRSTPSQFSPK